jgi:hypothetical protein
MVKHSVGIWCPDDREVGWCCVRSAPCTRRRGAQISWLSLKTKVDIFSRFCLKTGGFRFPSFGHKTGSYGLMIWTFKSPRQFLGLDIKTKWATVYWLHNKIIGRMKTAMDTRRDLAACFTWKQVELRFSSLALRLVEAQRGWCTWHHREGYVKLKLKMDGSMWRATSDPSTPTLSFSMYYVLWSF